VRNAASGTVYWEAVSTNPWGRLQNETFGNGVQTYTEYDPANGWLFKRQAGVGGGTGLIDAQVSWDYNGNFTTRQDLKQGLTETFVYDAMNRLDYSQRNGVTNLDVTLDAIGNMGSTPILRTLSLRLILSKRSVHVEAQALQP
jgi:hypothetical protein